MPALPFHTVTLLGLEKRGHPICTKAKASVKPIISQSLGDGSGKSIRALQWERRDGRKQNKNINPSQTLSTQHAALCTHWLLFPHTSSHSEIHDNSFSKYQPITAFPWASGIYMREECEGRIKETRRKEMCFHNLRLLSNQTKVQSLEKDERLSVQANLKSFYFAFISGLAIAERR